ncbi:type II toxin-antitoxin system RelE/ParE family toxin [Streptomyces sp. NPDC033538]|uniref:type II toxin-antitoxin system RelE family toxin n=1 Tax=Streptomyces sp. NPDC033538 TaxID=3155367 RepID=UPI0033E39726
MKYAFRFTTAAQRQLRAISRPDAMRVLTALTALTALGDDPYRQDADVKKLTGPSGLYRLRVGSYRIACRINDGELVALVVKGGDRRDVCRDL